MWFEDIALLSDVVAGRLHLSGVCQDTDDDKHLAAALEGRAACVVTGDPQAYRTRGLNGLRRPVGSQVGSADPTQA